MDLNEYLAQPTEQPKKKKKNIIVDNLGTIGSIALPAAAVALSPVTGGTSLLGLAALSGVGAAGGKLASQKLKGEKLDVKQAAKEGAISTGIDLATLGLGKVYKGAKAAKLAATVGKNVGKEVIEGTAETGLAKAGTSLRRKILNPIVPPSPTMASKMDMIQNTWENLGFRGSAQSQISQAPAIYKNLSNTVDSIIKIHPAKVTRDSIKSKVLSQLGDNIDIRLNIPKYEDEINSYLARIFKDKDVTAETLYKAKQALNSRLSNAYTKLEKGGTLTLTETVDKTLRDTFDDVLGDLVPQVKQYTVTQSFMHDAMPGLAKSAAKEFTLPVLGIKIPYASNLGQAATDFAGRTLQKAGGKTYNAGNTILDASIKGAARPAHQVALENALNTGNVNNIVNAFYKIPVGDAYRKSMFSLLPEEAQNIIKQSYGRNFMQAAIPEAARQIGGRAVMNQFNQPLPDNTADVIMESKQATEGLPPSPKDALNPLQDPEIIQQLMMNDIISNKGKNQASYAALLELAKEKELSAAEKKTITGADTANSLINEIETSLSSLPSGRISGNISKLGGVVGLNSEVNAYEQQRPAMALMLIKSIMGSAGQISDADRNAIQNSIPSVSDTQTERAAKLNRLRTIVEAYRGAILPSNPSQIKF